MDSKRLALGAAVALVLAVAVARPIAQQGGAPAMRQGLSVHGHWTIEIRRPDGSVVSRHEFDNALTGGGEIVLTSLLSRQSTARQWMVDLVAPDEAARQPCQKSTNPSALCRIEEDLPGGDPASNAVFRNLTVTTPSDGSGGLPRKIVLAGSATVSNTSELAFVYTLVERCDSDDPSTCRISSFTRHGLATPIPVTPGQIVQVTVEISFS